MRVLALAAIVILLGSPSWAAGPAQLDTPPLVLDSAQLDRVAAGDRHDTPFHFVIVNNQRALLALELALTRRLAGTAANATREHVLLARQVGFSVRD